MIMARRQCRDDLNLHAGPGIAVREVPTPTGPADCILFLLGTQTRGEFANYHPDGSARLFTDEYTVQHLQGRTIAPAGSTDALTQGRPRRVAGCGIFPRIGAPGEVVFASGRAAKSSVSTSMLALLTRLRGYLPGPLRRHATDDRLVLAAQLWAFGCTGLVGLGLDIATVYALRAPLGLYGAGMVGYVVAATGNWALNRVWTFRGASQDAAHRQWARYLIVNLVGMVLNRGIYALLVTFVAACAEEPAYAVAAGAVAGMGVNFILSRRLVFQSESTRSEHKK